MEEWNREIRARRFADASELVRWLGSRGVRGYPQTLLVMERFGYPEFLTASAEALVDGQYEDRPALRPVYDAVLAAVDGWEGVEFQARKSYVCLVAGKRTFARIQASTKDRVAVALRLDGQRPTPPLVASRVHPSMSVELRLATTGDLTPAALRWIRAAWTASR